MDDNQVNGRISVKQKEISVESDPTKKAEMQKELEILNWRKQIIFFQNKITQITEMKNYKVEIWFGPNKTELVLGGSNSAHALMIARKAYPQGRIISAKPAK